MVMIFLISSSCTHWTCNTADLLPLLATWHVHGVPMPTLRQLTGAIVYCTVLYGWHLLCAHHYEVQATPRRHVARAPGEARAGAPRGGQASLLASSRVITGKVLAKTPTKEAPVAKAPVTAAPATTAAAVAASATGGVSTGGNALDARCPNRKPIHCLLTAQATVYQQWQARIMYFHWKKQAKLDGECTDMTGFTRMVASEDGKPDGLEEEMPSVFVTQLTTAELSTLGHFGVLNRPYSVIQFIARGHLARIPEDYVYIAETDHVFMKPLQNLATPTTPVAFGFGYMHCGSGHQVHLAHMRVLACAFTHTSAFSRGKQSAVVLAVRAECRLKAGSPG